MHIQFVLFDGFDPLDVIAPYEVLHAGGSASGGAVTVELVSAEGPREVTSGIGALALRAVGAVDLERADMLLVPGAFGRVGEPGEVPEEEVAAGDRKQDEFIPVLLGRTLTTGLPALLEQAMADPGSRSPPSAAGPSSWPWPVCWRDVMPRPTTWASTCSTPPAHTRSTPVSWTTAT